MAGKAKVSVVPAPTSGLNLKDNIVQLQPTEATVMRNVYPDNGHCRLVGPYRAGFFATDTPETIKGANRRVSQLIAFSTVAHSSKLILLMDKLGTPDEGAALLYDIITGGLTDITGTFSTTTIRRNAPFAQFGPRIFVLPQTSTLPRVTNDGGVFTTTGFTPAGGVTGFSNIGIYKNRVYLSTGRTVQYGGVEAISGALTAFSFDYVFKTPGDITGVASTSKQTANVDMELFVVVNSSGEVLIYQGDWPGSFTWSIVGRYPVGDTANNCLFYVGTDLHVLSSAGAIPISSLLSNIRISADFASLTDKVSPVVKDSFASFGSSTSEKVMSATFLPIRQMVIVSLADRLAATTYTNRFLGMNYLSHAWFEINLGTLTPTTPCYWAEIKGRLFLLADTGLNLLEIDVHKPDTDALAHNTLTPLAPYVKTAHTYLDDPVNMKSIKQVRALLSARQQVPAAVSPTDLDFNWKIGTIRDFQDRIAESNVRFTAGHDREVHNAKWNGLADMARAVSFYYGPILPQVGATWTAPLLIKLFALEVMYETGSVM